MDDHDRRQFAAHFGRTHEVTLDRTGTLRRRVGDIFGFDARVVFSDLLRHRVIRAQGFEHRRRGKSADCVFGGTVEKFATIEHAVYVAVEKFQHFLRKVTGFESFHVSCPHWFSVCCGILKRKKTLRKVARLSCR